MRFRRTIAVAAAAFLPALSQARPLLTEPAETVGRLSFESGFSVSQRTDAFDSPRINYKTVDFPVSVRFGVSRFMDVGFLLTYISQRLESGSANLSGSRTGLFSPLIKISPWKNAGLLAIWHNRRMEERDQNLPVARGDDFEAIALYTVPSAWPLHMNAGYLWRGKYKSSLGVTGGPLYKIEPANIFEAKTSLEIPVRWHFNLLTELAYYKFDTKRIADVPTEKSAGEALDAMAGVTWSWGAWNLGTGAAFGLLDEKYTSFDLERGAGDVLYKASVSYKLTPRKPNR